MTVSRPSAPVYPEQPLDRWHRWRLDHPLLRADPTQPAPLDANTLRALAASILLDRQHRRLLRALLLDLLTDDITDIALAVAQEAHR